MNKFYWSPQDKIKELVEKESNYLWSKTPPSPLPLKDRIAYNTKVGIDYLKWKNTGRYPLF